ncbi:hypothetical protein F4821DRAFT_189073 [Hypoxylon rubiginosum]|uniref:Uncharacterized protein n=1 Tax=Hypoxylon rubiginosum TaxID=110542 RepID=A0ACC0DFT2_9PEZI|nr:hypothetical protein F4821DRAFT_189073 [Hypoxylon rubiginosum]
MALFPANRMSVGSLDEDQFYSTPSSRIATRHASLAPRNLQEETGQEALPSEPFVSVYQPGSTIPAASPENTSPVPKRALKTRWTAPFAMRHQDSKHHHFCPKPIGRHLHRTFHGTSESLPLLQPLGNELEVGPSGCNTPIISSPGSPIAMNRPSSAYYGSLSPLSGKLQYPASSPLEDLITINKQGTDSIVRNIRAYLSGRKHNDCSPRPGILENRNENRPLSWRFRADTNGRKNSKTRTNEITEDCYLVTTNDIAGILDIVIAGIRRIHDEGPGAGCLSMLLPQEALLKPTPNIKAIIPMSPTIADPATTISSVRPSFSLASSSQYQGQYLDTARTTFISRQSITEVT